MYHIRSASLAPLPESLITTSQLDSDYVKAQVNAPETPQLWRNILVEEFPKPDSSTQGTPNFTISPAPEPTGVPGDDQMITVSFTPTKSNHDPRVLVAMGLHGMDRDTKNERELLLVRFVTWSKRELRTGSGVPTFFGLLVLGTHARMVKYDKNEEVLRPFHDDEWLDARNDGWRTIINDVKSNIEKGIASI